MGRYDRPRHERHPEPAGGEFSDGFQVSCFGDDATAWHERDECVAERRPGTSGDQRLIGQLVDADDIGAGQRMVRRGDEDEFVVQQPDAFQLVEGMGISECHDEVQVALAKPGEQ